MAIQMNLLRRSCDGEERALVAPRRWRYNADDAYRLYRATSREKTSDGGSFACCIANGMTGAVQCVGTGAEIDFAGAVPEGGRKAGLRGWRQNDLTVDATKNDLHERRLPRTS